MRIVVEEYVSLIGYDSDRGCSIIKEKSRF